MQHERVVGKSLGLRGVAVLPGQSAQVTAQLTFGARRVRAAPIGRWGMIPAESSRPGHVAISTTARPVISPAASRAYAASASSRLNLAPMAPSEVKRACGGKANDLGQIAVRSTSEGPEDLELASDKSGNLDLGGSADGRDADHHAPTTIRGGLSRLTERLRSSDGLDGDLDSASCRQVADCVYRVLQRRVDNVRRAQGPGERELCVIYVDGDYLTGSESARELDDASADTAGAEHGHRFLPPGGSRLPRLRRRQSSGRTQILPSPRVADRLEAPQHRVPA